MRRPLVSCSVGALMLASGALAACSGDGGPEVQADATTTSSAGGAATTTSTACAVTGATTATKSAGGGESTALLTGVRTGRQACADRVVFDFRAARAPGYTIEYRPGPFARGESESAVEIAGSAFLVVRFDGASGVDLTDPEALRTYTGPYSLRPAGLAHVVEITQIEDFEGVLVWVVGLDSARPFAVGTLGDPSRVYIDITDAT